MNETVNEFICKQCTYCCTKQSTQINTTLLEIKLIKTALSLSVKELFLKNILSFIPFVRTDDLTKFEVEIGLKRPCPLLENGGCKVYEFRPINCRMYPYWYITNCIENEVDCTRNVKVDVKTGMKYRHYEKILGRIIIDEEKRTNEFLKRSGLNQTVDLSKNDDAKRLVELFLRSSKDSDVEKSRKYANKLTKLAKTKIDVDSLMQKIDLIEKEVESIDIEKTFEEIKSAEKILESE